MMIRNRLLTNWHPMRWVALSIGIFLAAMGIWYQDGLTGVLSAFFLIQALTNTGCMMGSGACAVPFNSVKESYDDDETASTSSGHQDSDIDYTEVK